MRSKVRASMEGTAVDGEVIRVEGEFDDGYAVAELLRRASEKMACLECGAMPCDLVFVRVSHGKARVEGEERLSIAPGYCRLHIPKAKRAQ